MLLLSSCGSNSGDRYGIVAPIDSIFQPVFRQDAPGAVVIVSRGDTVLYSRSYGMARLNDEKHMDENTMLNLASTTKTFTAAAVLKLEEEGKLSLDDRLIDYYPSLPEDIFGEITLRHVLSQSSGIPDKRPLDSEQWREYLSRNRSVFGFGHDYLIYGTEKEFTRYLECLDSLDFKPGSEFARRDPPYILLADIIEKASGQDFEEYMQRNIFAPAGIADACYVSSDSNNPKMAHGYRRAEGEAKPKVFRSADGRWDEYDYGEAEFFLTRADRGLYMSPKEFDRWQHAFYRGKVVSKNTLERMKEPILTTSPGQGYSLGLNISVSPAGKMRLYHRSTRGGFVAVEAYFPDRDVAYLIFSNRNDWDYNTAADAVEAALEKYGLL